MTDKLKDQDSSAPAATEGKKKVLSTTRKVGNVIINPPEKVDPQRGFHERFKIALAKHTVAIEEKTALVLQTKASRADLPADVIEQVYIRGFKSLPLNSELTREQYAMNRVNSFIAGGAAMQEDFDVLPIYERVGMKGTGGAMRPHIKREKSVYNGKTLYHVVDKAGHVKHSTSDEFAAKKHLATKYHTYNEGTLSPMKRFEGTKSLVKTYKDDTPGEKLKEAHQKKETKGGFKPLMAKLTPARGKGSFEMKVQEATSAAIRLQKAFQKAKEQSERERKLGDQVMDKIKTDQKTQKEEVEQIAELDKKTVGRYKQFATLSAVGHASNIYDREVEGGKKPDPEMHRKLSLRKKGLERADTRLKKEETELQELSKDTLNSYMWSAKHDRDMTDKKASKAIEKNRKEFSPKRHSNITKLLDKSTKRTGNIIKAAGKIVAKG